MATPPVTVRAEVAAGVTENDGGRFAVVVIITGGAVLAASAPAPLTARQAFHVVPRTGVVTYRLHHRGRGV